MLWWGGSPCDAVPSSDVTLPRTSAFGTGALPNQDDPRLEHCLHFNFRSVRAAAFATPPAADCLGSRDLSRERRVKSVWHPKASRTWKGRCYDLVGLGAPGRGPSFGQDGRPPLNTATYSVKTAGLRSAPVSLAATLGLSQGRAHLVTGARIVSRPFDPRVGRYRFAILSRRERILGEAAITHSRSPPGASELWDLGIAATP